MMQEDILKMGINEAALALRSKKISSVELTRACLERIDQNADTGAFITVCRENALQKAKIADQMIKNGENLHILTGIPMAIKDNICTKGIRTTCASRMLEGYIPTYGATAAEKLSDTFAVLLGKTNMDEFGMGSTTENSAFGATHNPLNKNLSAGGSSGGSAAAVSGGMAFYALGSDTGGSIRLPAAFCNLVGLCPTYGAISRHGLIAYASSLDRIAPIAKSAKDCKLVFDALKGADPMDQTCQYPFTTSSKSVTGDLKNVKIAVISQFLDQKMDAGVKNAFSSTLLRFKELGAQVEYVSVENVLHSVGAYYVISCAEASSNLARYDGVRVGAIPDGICAENYHEFIQEVRGKMLGKEVRRRIMLGTFMLSDENREKYYKNAVKFKNHITVALESVLDRYDLILSPVYADTPPALGNFEKSPVSFYEKDVFCLPFSLAGLPSLALPCGELAGGMPVGIQISAKKFCEDLLFDVAQIYEEALK